MSGVFIVAAKRTPFGAFGGKLASQSATQLGVVASRAALAALSPTTATLSDTSSYAAAATLVDAVYFGNVIPSSVDAAYLARHVGLYAGVPMATPALTVNRLCGSGLETVIQATRDIRSDDSYQVVLAGGTENMSQAPLQVAGTAARWGVALGKGLAMTDALWDGLTDQYVSTPMGMTAEHLAVQYGISREECDAYAIRSQTLWKQAHAAGVFDAEMAAVETNVKGKIVIVDTDEHPRESSLEKLAALKPVFKKDGVVTAATSSGICDGAGAIILASEAAVAQHNWTPLARVVSYGITGCDPKIMGIGPVTAIQQALRKANLTLHQMDRIEINEAFAAQVLACAKELDIDWTKFNLHGGAISLGHPLGASGSRILAHLAHEFARSPDNRYHVGSACIGGGQGIAVILERA
jgi:acetyl-CoA acyltransferase 2